MSFDSLSAGTATGHPATSARPVRLAYLVSHPIQYQAPLLRRIAADPAIDLTVFFGSDFSVRGYSDRGFGVDVKWDIPLLEGYKHEFLPALRDNGTAGVFSPISVGLSRRLAGDDDGAGFDVLWVHGYSTVNQMHGILAAKAIGIPVLVRSDSSLDDRPRGWGKLALKRVFFGILRELVDGVLVSGTKNLAYWRYYFGEDFPMFLLPYAVDNDWFQEQSRLASAGRGDLRAELGLDPERPVILFASKLQTRKHCNDLIAAYEKLAPAPGQEPAAYLVIVGDGEEREALERQAAATGFRSIRFCGFRNQSELPRYLDLCTVFVLPSRHEPWGLIVNEAMNAGRAVILSDNVGCQPDLVTDGIEGYVYPVRNVDALAEALRKVLGSAEGAAAMGQRALARITHWSFEEDVMSLRQAIAEVTGRTSGERVPENDPAGYAPTSVDSQNGGLRRDR
jgi:glycosyltransferase involved in cell wall biosynthesis